MLTLTLKSKGGVSAENVKADYERILKCFQKLTRWLRKLYPGVGGFRTVEIGDGGNVHIHSLSYLPFIAQKVLAEKWKEITGDSSIVDIRAAWSKRPDGQVIRGALTEALKYITKIAGRDPRELVDIYIALKGRQVARAWGVCHGLVWKAEVQKVVCEHCGGTDWLPEAVLEMKKRRAQGP